MTYEVQKTMNFQAFYVSYAKRKLKTFIETFVRRFVKFFIV
jgi:hypothetical protein